MLQNLILFIIFFTILFVLLYSRSSKNVNVVEGYRDPIYMNRAKLVYDYYPRTNGTIYGFSRLQGGSWDMFSGYPQYYKAY